MADNILSEADSRRFWERTRWSPYTGCLEWIAGKTGCGYGGFRVWGKHHLAHRVAWIAANGSIPNDGCVLHHCDNPACVNIDHLFVGGARANCTDMVSKGRHKEQKRTECKSGHPLVPIRKNRSRAERGCPICRRERARRYYANAHRRVRASPAWVVAGLTREAWLQRHGGE